MLNSIRWILCTAVLFALLPANRLYAQERSAEISHLIPAPTCISGLNCELLIPFGVQGLQIEANGQEIDVPEITHLDTKTNLGANVIVIDFPQPVRDNPALVDSIANALKDINGKLKMLDEDTRNQIPWFIYGIGVNSSNDLFPIRQVAGDRTIQAYRDINGIGYAAINDVIQTFLNDYRSSQGPIQTEFFAPMMQLLGQSDNVQSLICLCEGVDSLGQTVTLTDIINVAQQKRIPVHVSQIWANPENTGRSNLETLATETGGTFIPLDPNTGYNPDSMNVIWNAVERTMTPYVVPFTLPDADVQNLQLTLTLLDGETVTHTVSVTPGELSLEISQVMIDGQTGDNILPIAPDASEMQVQVNLVTENGQPIAQEREPSVEVHIGAWTHNFEGTSGTIELTPLARAALQETEGAVTLRVHDKYGTTVSQDIKVPLAAPRLPVLAIESPVVGQVPIELPEGQPLILQATVDPWEPVSSINFSIYLPNGELLGEYPGAIEQQNLSLSAAIENSGDYTVVAHATLESGDVIESEPASVNVSIVPTTSWADRLTQLALIPLLALIVGGGYWLWRRRQPEEPDDSLDEMLKGLGVSPPITEAKSIPPGTQPVFPASVFPRATLLWVRGGEDLPKEILLPGFQRDGSEIHQWTIGRLSEKGSEYLIDALCVSGRHATIFEENGQFYIRDELSTGGTYVDKRKLKEYKPEPLANNSIVNFNAISYRFVIEEETPYNRSQPLWSPAKESKDNAPTKSDKVNNRFVTQPATQANQDNAL